MGSIERIESKIDILTELVRQVLSSSPVSVKPVTVTPETVKPVTVTPVETHIDVNGTKWDKRIHSANQTKTQKGVFKKRKGISAELFDEVMAAQATSLDTGLIADLPTTPAVAPPPTPSVVKSPPSPPTTPTAPAVAPPPVDPFEEDKKSAMDSIAVLTTSYGVTYEQIIVELPDNVKDFNGVANEKLKEVTLKMKTWSDWLGMCHDENLKIQTLGADEGVKGMMVIYGHYNGATNTNRISPEHLPVVHSSLAEYRAQWEKIQ